MILENPAINNIRYFSSYTLSFIELTTQVSVVLQPSKVSLVFPSKLKENFVNEIESLLIRLRYCESYSPREVLMRQTTVLAHCWTWFGVA